MTQVNSVASEPLLDSEALIETKPKKKEQFSSLFLAFNDKLLDQIPPEEKLESCIKFMKDSLSQKGVPRFKDFWDAKGVCLKLFKEKIPQSVKEVFWSSYLELALEAKRLKDLLESQSNFALEQIDLALISLKRDLEQLSLPQQQMSFERLLEFQKPIEFYITLTTRLKGLREEILKTEMRIKNKNRLLKEISELGDQFIPRKKEWIKQMSALFLEEVEKFSKESFNQEKKEIHSKENSAQDLRNKIKEFQELAKKLALSSHAFSKSREILSCCWEILKNVDKEKKRAYQQKRAEQESANSLLEQGINQFLKSFDQVQQVQPKEAFDGARALFSQIESSSIGFLEKKAQKGKVKEAIAKVLEPYYLNEKKAQAQKIEKELQLKNEFLDFKEQLLELVRSASTYSQDKICEGKKVCEERKKALKLSEKQSHDVLELEKLIEEALLEKRFLDLKSKDAIFSKSLLCDLEKFKEASKDKVEAYRKEKSLSGFDFEKAMIFSELADQEKGRLDRVTQRIEELEDLIEEL
jgi:hypothetical protein